MGRIQPVSGGALQKGPCAAILVSLNTQIKRDSALKMFIAVLACTQLSKKKKRQKRKLFLLFLFLFFDYTVYTPWVISLQLTLLSARKESKLCH